jgi:hypothetical protein
VGASVLSNACVWAPVFMCVRACVCVQFPCCVLICARAARVHWRAESESGGTALAPAKSVH